MPVARPLDERQGDDVERSQEGGDLGRLAEAGPDDVGAERLVPQPLPDLTLEAEARGRALAPRPADEHEPGVGAPLEDARERLDQRVDALPLVDEAEVADRKVALA